MCLFCTVVLGGQKRRLTVLLKSDLPNTSAFTDSVKHEFRKMLLVEKEMLSLFTEGFSTLQNSVSSLAVPAYSVNLCICVLCLN